MTAQTEPYVRVYYSIIDDPKFEGIYSDDAALAAWLRLLLIADAMWPAPAPLPRSLKRSALSRLVSAGLVDLVPVDSYRIHGLDAERGKRRDAASAAASKRWDSRNPRVDAPAMRPHSESNATASGHEMPRDARLRAETSNSEPRRAVSPAPETVLQLLAEELTGTAYVLANLHGGYGVKAMDQLSRHGIKAVITAWRLVAENVEGRPTIRQILFAADDLLNPVRRIDSKAQDKAEREAEDQARIDREAAKTQRYLRRQRGETDAA